MPDMPGASGSEARGDRGHTGEQRVAVTFDRVQTTVPSDLASLGSLL